MARHIPAGVLAIAHQRAAELVRAGAQAVVLTGSQAAGTPLPYADIDLLAVGEGPHYRLERRAAHLLAIAWRTVEQVRASFQEPGPVGTVIPGWRDSLSLLDPEGVAAGLQAEAQAWTWDGIAEACDRHVADEAWGYAEEVHKLAGALAAGQTTVAAVQRSIIALRLPGLLAIHRRLLYGSENRLWDLLAEVEGAEWAAAQSRALGTALCSFDQGCRAALELYLLYVAAVGHLVQDDEALAVIDGACGLARSALAGGLP